MVFLRMNMTRFVCLPICDALGTPLEPNGYQFDMLERDENGSSYIVLLEHNEVPPTLYLGGAPVAAADWAYWLIGRLYPTTDAGLRLTRQWRLK